MDFHIFLSEHKIFHNSIQKMSQISHHCQNFHSFVLGQMSSFKFLLRGQYNPSKRRSQGFKRQRALTRRILWVAFGWFAPFTSVGLTQSLESKPTKNRLFGVTLSLQPLPSLRSVQWPSLVPLLSLPREKLEIEPFNLYLSYLQPLSLL